MQSGIVFYITNLILNIFWMVAANMILQSRYSKVKTVLLETLIQFPSWLILQFTTRSFSNFRLISGLILFIIIIFYFHTDRPMFKFLTAIMIFITTVFTDMGMGMVIPREIILSGVLFQQNAVGIYSVYLILSLFLQSLVVIGLRSYNRRYHGLLVETQWLLFIIFPFSQMMMFMVFWRAYLYVSQNDPWQVILILAIDILADAALIYTFYKTASNTELRIRSEMLEEQIRSQENYYDQLASTYTSIRRMRHDIDNHLYTMRALLDHGSTKDAMEYADKVIEEDHANVHFSDCRNTVVASYLEKKLEDMNSLGITLETDIHLPAHLSVSNPDLICIYGNILDNASEACREIENAVIILKTEYRRPYLTISCRNPVQVQANEKKQRIPGLERGVGLTILSHLAEQYDGQFSAEKKGSSYETVITIKTEEDPDA